MPRKLDCAAPVWTKPDSEREEWSLTLSTITPLFGGSAVAREVDAAQPIRAASVRGHLRYWWRATAGAGFATSEELYRAESALWGRTSKDGVVESASRVSVRVSLISVGRPAPLREYLAARPSPSRGPEAGYFVFPFNEDNQNSVADGRKEIVFRLLVTLPARFEAREALQRAIRAWLTFGGVGARTRRGCGALSCEEKGWLADSPSDTAYFRALTQRGPGVRGYPVLGGGFILFDEPFRDAETSWKNLGSFWAQFRKGHFTEKRPHYEPMSGGQWNDHATLKRIERSGNIAPLGKPYLGLPVIYQKFDGSFVGKLEPEQSGRMASPIILKPVAFADGLIRPMVACLRAPVPDAIKIEKRVVSLEVPSDDPVMTALKAHHPLDAVRNAAIKCGFKEVNL